MCGEYSDGGVAGAAEEPMSLGATLSSTSAIASMERKMALPMAVLRAVVKLSMALSSEFVLSVGGWINSAKPANATIPTCLPDISLFTKDWAASFAASSRFGGISVEHMLLETSIAMIIMALLDGTTIVATGRASAKTRLARASMKNANGKCLRNRD